MRIATVSTLGVSGLVDRELAFEGRESDGPARVVALTGARGRGKTRLLEAIAAAKESAAPYGALPASSDWTREGRPAKVQISWWLDEDERSFAGVVEPALSTETLFLHDKLPQSSGDPGLRAILARYEHRTTSGKVDYIPADRRIPRFASRSSSLLFDQKQRRLGRDEGKYGVLPHFVVELYRHRPEEAAQIADAFARLSGGRRLLGIDDVGGLMFDAPSGGTLTLERLPRADETAFLLAATLFMIGIERSVVLFDVPELHQASARSSRRLRRRSGWWHRTTPRSRRWPTR
jgi:hypothetical protein